MRQALGIGRLALATLGLAALGIMSGCSGGGGTEGAAAPGDGGGTGGGEKPLVAFAQANSQDPWRQVFNAGMQAEADKHSSEFAFEIQDAQDDANKQISQIDSLLVKNPKVLLVSAKDVSVTQECEKAFDKKIPVILLDRAIESEKYTCYISGDNTEIGRQAGEFMGKTMNGKGTILMIQGIAGATPTDNRKDGFMEAIKKYPGITVIQGDNCDYQRKKARDYMDSFLQSGKAFDAIYAHNDEMAIGAYLALEAKKISGKPIVGIDGCQQEVVDYIKAGKLTATFTYPNPGPEGIRVAAEILKGNMPKDKKIVLPTTIVTKQTAEQFAKDNPNLAK